MNEKLDIISLNEKAWNRIADKYEKANYGKINPIFEFFYKNLPKSGLILDVGSGTGVPHAKLLVEKGFIVLGIDISPKMIQIAEKNVPRAQFLELSMTDLNYENKFDGALSSFSMLLLDPPRFKDVARRIACSLKKKGLLYLALNEPSESGVNVDDDVIVEIMGEKMYSRPYTKEEMLETFIPLGMELLKFNRELQSTEIFGIEHSTFYIFQKE